MAIGSATSPTGGTVSCWRIVAAARPAQVATICDLVPSYVTPEPEHSVLLLADFSNAQIDRNAVEHLKVATVFDRPHLKRSAWVITPSFPKAFYENVKAFSVRDLRTFQTGAGHELPG